VNRCGKLITEPTRFTLSNGYITAIENNSSGKRFKRLLESCRRKDRNKNAYFIAEFAIGTNPTTKVTGCVLEDEKVLGTCHIAFGDNTSYPGPPNKSILHMDVIMMKPTIYLNDRLVMRKGDMLL
jgi:leucyl aminopeptidase (aminopeptidase T)